METETHNADGTLKVPVTPVTPAEGEPKAEDTAQIEEPATLAGVVEELKETRKERALYKEVLDGLLAQQSKPEVPETPTTETEVEKAVRLALEQREASRTKDLKQSVLGKFIAEHKEYNAENDPTGLKRQALTNKLNLFNTDGIASESDYLTVIRDAHRLAGGSDTTPQTSKDIPNPYSSTPTTPSSVVPTKGDELDDAEKAVIAKVGMTPERFKELKAKNPDFIKQIMKPAF